MDMHNKDIDQLFRSQLADIEATPSAGVWDNIAAGLNKPGHKRSMMPYLRIAATVIVVLGAGLWLMLKQVQPGAQVVKHPKLAANQPQEQSRQTTPGNKHSGQVVAEPVGATTTITAAGVAEPVNQLARLKKETSTKVITGTIVNHPAHADSSLSNATNQPQLATVTVPAKPEVQAVVPDAISPAKAAVQEDNSFRTNAAANQPVQTLAAADTDKPKRHRGIHSLGDVVNIVVSKVDKRQDKLIEFTDTDDDEAEVTGINLGLFRVKKQK